MQEFLLNKKYYLGMNLFNVERNKLLFKDFLIF